MTRNEAEELLIKGNIFGKGELSEMADEVVIREGNKLQRFYDMHSMNSSD